MPNPSSKKKKNRSKKTSKSKNSAKKREKSKLKSKTKRLNDENIDAPLPSKNPRSLKQTSIKSAFDPLPKIYKDIARRNPHEDEDNQIEIAQAELEAAQKTEDAIAIQAAEDVLNEALQERLESVQIFEEMQRPDYEVNRISTKLKKQIASKADDITIEQTREQLKEAQLDMEAMQTFNPNTPSNLPPILPQQNLHATPELDYQNMQDELSTPPTDNREHEHDSPSTPERMEEEEDQASENNNEDDHSNDSQDNHSDRDEECKSSENETTTPDNHVNVAQKQLQSALKILSPKEKMEQMKKQAKLNAAKAKKAMKQLLEKKNKKSIEQLTTSKMSATSKKDESKAARTIVSKNDSTTSSKDNRAEKSPVNKIATSKTKLQKSKKAEKNHRKSRKNEEKNKANLSTEEFEPSDDDTSSANSESEYGSEESEESESEGDSEESESESESEKSESDESDGSEESEEESEASENDESDSESSSNTLTKSQRQKQSKKNKSKNKKGKEKKSKKQTKISITRTNSVYYSMKLKITKGSVPTKQLLKHLRMWFKQLQKLDPTAVIYDYGKDIPTRAIPKPTDIPTDITKMKEFFNAISIRPNGGHTWFQVWLGHDDSVDNILINMKQWLNDNDSQLYKKRLQAKFTVKEYWLLWSTERMNPESLHNAVEPIVKKLVNKTFSYSFVFSPLRKDPRMSSNPQTSKFCKAMHIEVKKEEKEQIYQILGRIFSTTNNLKILGTDLRMVPLMSNELPSHTKMKVAHLMGKQEQFLATMKSKPCIYLQEIDYRNRKLGKTMREMIMELETLHTQDKKGNSMTVFTNVDYSQWHSCYLVTFPEHLEQEADDYITQLPSFLHYLYGDEVLTMFNAEGAVKAQNAQWDPEKLCATSNLDFELDAVTSESADISWLPDQSMSVQFDLTNLQTQNLMYTRATDADSVSTFASKRYPRDTMEINEDEPTTKKARTSDTDNSTTSSQSSQEKAGLNRSTSNIISPPAKSFQQQSPPSATQIRESELNNDANKTSEYVESSSEASL